ncbi:MAG TPA: hypothetical protein VEX69_10570 [Candidatus Limnocylindria bacterium]|nr:hypothetical protein [Candidatus Limnocylindria bacterium]
MARSARFIAFTVGSIAFCAIGVLGYRAWAPKSAGWITFSPPVRSFSILLPGEPQQEDQEAVSDSTRPPTTIHFVTAEGTTSTFFCHYWDLSYTPAGEADEQIAMAGSRDGMIRNYDGKLLSSQASISDGHYAQDFTATTTDNGIMEGRFFIVGQRLYMLAVARPAEEDDEVTKTFFNSFKLSFSSR